MATDPQPGGRRRERAQGLSPRPDRPHRQRLDQRLVDDRHCDSRARAQSAIRAGLVRVAGHLVDKPGTLIAAGDPVEVIAAEHPYVSRGGVKLAAALDLFAVDPANRVCLDAGVSTGGFTDCLLARGAARVIAVDVGYAQIAWRLRTDPRVVLLERTNLRHLEVERLRGLAGPGGPLAGLDFYPSLVTLDLSFISLRLIWPVVLALMGGAAHGGRREVVALVKPQFEVGREHVGKGGIVRQAPLQVRALVEVATAASDAGLVPLAFAASPIRGGGGSGNREFLLHLVPANTAAGIEMPPPAPLEAAARTVVETAQPQSVRV